MFRKKIDKEERLRRKLVNNELNPIGDFILTVLVFCITPLMWFITQVQDKLMFKFIGKSYIYNVSWEVSYKCLLAMLQRNLSCIFTGPSDGPTRI